MDRNKYLGKAINSIIDSDYFKISNKDRNRITHRSSSLNDTVSKISKNESSLNWEARKPFILNEKVNTGIHSIFKS